MTLAHAILRVASLLAPAERRGEFRREWRSELWYIPCESRMRFAMGAFRDAMWVRRHHPRTAPVLQSPLACLAFLAAISAAALLIAAYLPSPELPPPASHLRSSDLPAGCVVMLGFSCLILPLIRVAMGPPSDVGPAPYRQGRWRRALFLALKIVLVQPLLLSGFIVLLLTGPIVPFVPQLAVFSLWALTLRWVLLDQRRRCPVCLRLLTEPVRIGSASETFLEWYGAESMCARGHGLLQAPEFSASYSGARRWLNLDASWSELFPAGDRR